MNQLITIRDRRQITLPGDLIKKWGVDVGDKIVLTTTSDNRVLIEPVVSQTTDLLEKIQAVVRDSKVSERQLQKSGIEMRKELNKKNFPKIYP